MSKKTIGLAGLVPGHDPGDLVQLVLVVHQVGERNAGEQVVDALLQHSPHRPDATRRVRTTSLGIDRVKIAVDFEGDVLRGLDHIFDRNGLRITREENRPWRPRSEEHTSELQSQSNLVCRLLLEKKKKKKNRIYIRHIIMKCRHLVSYNTVLAIYLDYYMNLYESH